MSRTTTCQLPAGLARPKIVGTVSLELRHQLAHYEILAPIGKGGMGEVYRARDGKLGRDVAIKVLAEELSQDKEWLQRFQREARLLAQLNHSNIATLHGLEEADGQQFLVMELVEGETLAERIARGPIPLDEVLSLIRQIAEGLEAAHEKGVIHRDLKPPNIKVTPDGDVKVLDFGLAKAFSDKAAPSTSTGLSESPTLVHASTGAEMILGTLAYMSPQQARGQVVDRRADIWAFGCVLYQMLTGVSAFRGATSSDLLVQVLTCEPKWDALPAGLPPALRRLLERCLEKDPRRRLRDFGDALFEIEEASAQLLGNAVTEASTARSSTTWTQLLLWTGVSVLIAILAFAAGRLGSLAPATGPPALHARIELTPGINLWIGMRPSVAVSPEGRSIVLAVERNGVPQLYRRPLAEDAFVPLDGTLGGTGPFFSPDGLWLGFFADGKLKKVPTVGGAAIVLADAPVAQGGSFAPDGSVVFAPVHGDGLWQVPAQGGPAEPITTVDRARGEAGHHWPHVLPDGKHVLMTVELNGKPYSEAHIVLASLETKEQRVIVQGGSDGRYLPSGHLAYWHRGDLWTVPFALTTLATSGAAVPVVRDVMSGEPNGFAQVGFSRGGSLVYIAGRHPQEERSLVRFDRLGALETLTTERRGFENVRISPDGRRLAVTITAANDAVWVYELERRLLTRVTYDEENLRPIWSPQSDRLLVAARPGGRSYQLRILAADGGDTSEIIRESEEVEQPESWSPSGDFVAFTQLAGDTGSDIWVLPMTGNEKPQVFLSSRFDEAEARFSPDGRWIAYQSNESGQFEVYLRAFPGPGIKRQISIEGGTQPRWRQDGREMFYRRGDLVMAVDVTLGTDATVSVPRQLFEAPFQQSTRQLDLSSWDILPDGSGFIMTQDHSEPVTGVNLVLGWLDEDDRLGSGP